MARLSPPSTLAAVQSLMARAVMRPLTGREEMQRTWGDGSPAASVADGFIKPNDRLSSIERLQIYNQQYWWRLKGALAEEFPGLRAVLGERAFEHLCTTYLDHSGSRSWTMRDLGSGLEDFLREQSELTSPRLDLALDMVRVEWADVVAFDGDENPPKSVTQITGVPPSRLRLGLQPYLTLLELRYPIDRLLLLLKRQGNSETETLSQAVGPHRPQRRRRLSATVSKAPIYLAVHRVNFSVYHKRLEPAAYYLLNALQRGATLKTACGEAMTNSADAGELSAEKLQHWFADWMGFGWFT